MVNMKENKLKVVFRSYGLRKDILT